MKKYKTKVLTFLLAGALCSAALGGTIAVSDRLSASAAEGITYDPTRLFWAGNSATAKADTDDETKLAFTFTSAGTVAYRRDLALKWFAETGTDGAVEANYLSMTFSFKDTAFSEFSLTMETSPASAVKDDKAVNKIVFENADGGLVVKVNDDETGVALSGGILANTTDDIVLTLSETDGDTPAESGEFFVLINGTVVGSFENVGANFAEYFSTSSSTPMVPLLFDAEFPEDAEADAETVVLFKELNGQSFALTDGSISDTAEPVLVVNDVVTSFALGMPFSLDYEVIDVLDSSVSSDLEYYQYDPTDEEASYENLSTSVYFFDTVYTVGEGEDAVTSSVYAEEGMEFVSVRFTLEDENFVDDEAAVYYLSWYATETVKPASPAHDEDLEYIRVDRNETGPVYTGIYNDDENKTTTVTEEGETLFAEYQARVEEAAADVNAGSNSYFYLPSLRGLIADDDTGYANLQFTIYYKTSSSSSASTSSDLDADELRLSVSTAGLYEFKVSAVDKVGNATYVYQDGHKTEVDEDTIWDIEEIPSFTFSVYNAGLTVEDEEDSRRDTGYIDTTYSGGTDFTVTGISGYGEQYGLYYFDTVEFQNRYSAFAVSQLSDVTFETLKEMEQADVSEDKMQRLRDDAVGYYAELYAQAIADNLGLDISGADLLSDENGTPIMRRIEEYDSTIDEDDFPDEWAASDNKYHWDADAQSFRPQEQGTYVIFAVFNDSELFGDYAAAYTAVSVDADRDVIPGETEWLRNNIASIVLFSVAGVMLIIIIILLLVKPSDESLEDVDAAAAAAAKKGKKAKKTKKK